MAEMENYTKMEMSKITKWSKENKLLFKDQKAKVMLIPIRRKEQKLSMYTSIVIMLQSLFTTTI
jgi:hypothetical protein